jgi:HSP20 family protein
MPETIDIEKAPARRAAVTVVPWSVRRDLQRLFDAFDIGRRWPTLRQMFDFERFWRREAALGASLAAVDVSEDDKGYEITVELPGMDEKNIDVQLSWNVLLIKGENEHEKDKDKDKDYNISERSYGSFQRSFQVPDGVDRDKVAATFGKGVLRITLPKTADAQKTHKKIEIKPT